MAAEVKKEIELELAHVLFIDIVGYSRLLINDQRALLETLNQIVRGTDQFRKAEAAERLIKIPTGDGMALVFYNTPEAPVECALEISRLLKTHPELQLRMGVHSGPVSGIVDVNERANVAGAGINIAQRVMDCGDAGHILVSKHVAEDLEQYGHWQPHLHHLGECEVKHSMRVSVANLYTDELGNPQVPEKFRATKARGPAGTNKKWILVGGGILILLALAFLFLRIAQKPSPGVAATEPPPKTASPPVVEKSIAVLPFENLSRDPDNAFFTDGVQDEILTNLARLADLKVISRTSVMVYKGPNQRNLREIGQQLGVSHVLEGSVQRSANRVRVMAQLIDARTDRHLWAQSYDRDLADVFAIQSEIAKTIADQLQAKLSPSEKAAIEQPPTDDLVAHDFYVRAKTLADIGGSPAFGARVRENLLESARLLDQAVARAPTFFLAYCKQAEVSDRLYFFGSDHTPARLALADSAVKSAMRLQPDSGEAHLALGRHLYMGFRDYDRARAELATAGRALPNESQVFAITAFIDRRQGRWEEHIRNSQRALELDPRNGFLSQEFSVSYRVLRRYDEMAAILDRALALAPDDVVMQVGRALVDFDSRADTKRLHKTIETNLAGNPDAAGTFAFQWLNLALCERDSDAARRAVAAISYDGLSTENTWFPRAWFEALAARARGDAAATTAAFTAARAEVERILKEQPEYGEELSLLGRIDAGLGRKEDAIREGRRAVELLPETKDALNGVNVMLFLALIYAWTGEKDRAFEQLAAVIQRPGYLSYGRLKLHPEWDSLRGDPRFQKVLESLAPKANP